MWPCNQHNIYVSLTYSIEIYLIITQKYSSDHLPNRFYDRKLDNIQLTVIFPFFLTCSKYKEINLGMEPSRLLSIQALERAQVAKLAPHILSSTALIAQIFTAWLVCGSCWMDYNHEHSSFRIKGQLRLHL